MTRAEILDCLTDRPCDSCKFHESGRCERWNCVFEEKPDDAEDDAISRHDAIHLADELKDDLPDDEQMADMVTAHNEGISEYQTKLSLLPPVTPKIELKPNKDGVKTEINRVKTELESEDCISRQAVINLMRGLTRWGVRSEDGKFTNVGLLYDDVMFGLDRLPPVTPKQKMGYWILDHVVCDVIYEYHCSACGHHLELGGRTIKQDQAEGYSLFCNGCGAKMRESGVGNDGNDT